MKKYLAEFIGTFALLFLGTGAILLHNESGVIPPIGIVLSFGITLFVMIFLLGKISGAHFNPAVTIGLCIGGFFSKKELIPYILAQSCGAFVAVILLSFFFPFDEYLGATLPKGQIVLSFILEIMITFVLMFVILFVSTSEKTKILTAAFSIALVIVLAGIMVGPISGASMNPARSIAPALVSGHTEYLWIYLLAPIVGALLATFIFNFIKPKITQ